MSPYNNSICRLIFLKYYCNCDSISSSTTLDLIYTYFQLSNSHFFKTLTLSTLLHSNNEIEISIATVWNRWPLILPHNCRPSMPLKSSNFCDVIRCASDFRNHCLSFNTRIYFYCSDYLLGSQFFLCLSFSVLYFFFQRVINLVVLLALSHNLLSLLFRLLCRVMPFVLTCSYIIRVISWLVQSLGRILWDFRWIMG